MTIQWQSTVRTIVINHHQDNSSPVNKLLSKQHQINKENVLPSTSRATRSAQSRINRPILENLTNKPTQIQPSRLDEITEEDRSASQDEEMPQLNSPTSSQVLVTNHPVRHSRKGPMCTSTQLNKKLQTIGLNSDDAVTPKTPKITKQQEIALSDQSTDKEVILLEEEMVKTDEQNSPQYTGVIRRRRNIEG